MDVLNTISMVAVLAALVAGHPVEGIPRPASAMSEFSEIL